MSIQSEPINVLAPLSGRIVPIEEVPDPAFSQKMVGDGLAIDPTSDVVCAPIDGRLIEVHASRHAVVIEHASAVKIMVHIGIETVMLGGRGFHPLVKAGDTVRAGQPLLRFDTETVAAAAVSLLTEVVVLNDECIASIEKRSDAVEAGRSVLMTLRVAANEPAPEEPEPIEKWLRSPFIALPNPAGLHGRPAAMLAREARRYGARIVLSYGVLEADAKSVVEVLGLATGFGGLVRVSASGRDAPAALQRLEQLLRDGCGEAIGNAAAPVRAVARDEKQLEPMNLPPRSAGFFRGGAAAPGLALGRIVKWKTDTLRFEKAGGEFDQECERLFAAMRCAAEQIEALASVGAGPDTAEAEIMGAHLALLDDPALIDAAVLKLRAGASAASAWYETYESTAAHFSQHVSPLLRERASDIRDVGLRVMSHLEGVERFMPVLPERSVVVADDLTPSDTLSLDRDRVVGLCMAGGGPTSHVAILARSMGIPAVCGLGSGVLALNDGVAAVVDGHAGTLHADPDAALLGEVARRMEDIARENRTSARIAQHPGATRDGHRVEVVANVVDAGEAEAALAAGAEGVGLLRSEFLFEDRAEAPDEDEQSAAYRAVLTVLGPERKCVVRTLDVGGDKPLRYLPLPKETNPFLGLRGIRVSLAYPELLRSQLRAMLRAAPAGDLHIMLPMISDLDEVIAAKRILLEEQEKYPHPVKLGVMVEVPAAATLVAAIASEVDFFSIGTNDLAQYTLAIDRGHARLASRVDTVHPAVLKMIELTVSGAHAHGKWVGVCGAMASDPVATAVLVGLGVDELSVSVPAIAAVKARLATLDFEDCRALAGRLLRLGSAVRVRELLGAC